MAESSSEPAAAADLQIEHNKEEPPLPVESVSKELIVTMTTEGPGLTPGSDVGAEVPSSNGAADSPLPAKVPEEEEEATPTPPESSSLSSENGTVTAVTTEEESLSALLRHIKAEGGQDRGGELGKTRSRISLQTERSPASVIPVEVRPTSESSNNTNPEIKCYFERL